MSENQEILVGKMQEEMHNYAAKIINESPELEYKDIIVVYLLMKIAELQEEIANMKGWIPAYQKPQP